MFVFTNCRWWGRKASSPTNCQSGTTICPGTCWLTWWNPPNVSRTSVSSASEQGSNFPRKPGLHPQSSKNSPSLDLKRLQFVPAKVRRFHGNKMTWKSNFSAIFWKSWFPSFKRPCQKTISPVSVTVKFYLFLLVVRNSFLVLLKSVKYS